LFISVQYPVFNPVFNPARQVQHLHHQMSNILHTLSSTFTTCACGAQTQDCTINRMAAFVDGVPTGSGQQEQHVDLGPLVGRKRGFKTKERIPLSGGIVGMVMCRDNEASPRQSLPASPSSPILSERSIKGKGRAVDEDGDLRSVITLPLEIIVEIMKELDWYSLLNIRQVRHRPCLLYDSCCCSDMQVSQCYFEIPCCEDKPIPSIRSAAHAVGAFRATAGLVLGTGIGEVGIG
jgi:hypothetical protein